VLFNWNTTNFISILTVTVMNRLNSGNCFMLFYYQIVTCLLVTWAAAADVGLHVDATAYFFPVNDSFSDVIMNEHLKLKTVNGHTVWGGVPSGEGTSPKQAQVANFSPPKYWTLSILISDCCLQSVAVCCFMIYLRPRSAILTHIGSRRLYWEARPYQTTRPGVLVILTLAILKL